MDIYDVYEAGSGGRTATGTKITPYPAPADLDDSCGGSANADPGPLAPQAVFQAGTRVTV